MDAGKIGRFLKESRKTGRLYAGAVFVVWAALWANFIARDLFRHEKLRYYSILLQRRAEAKRAYIYGDRFFKLLKVAKRTIPPARFYRFAGIKRFSLRHRRAVYYLYPLLESDKSDYVLDAERFSLKKSLK